MNASDGTGDTPRRPSTGRLAALRKAATEAGAQLAGYARQGTGTQKADGQAARPTLRETLGIRKVAVTWDQARAASQRILGPQDMTEVAAAIPGGRCTFLPVVRSGWPGRLSVLRQDDRDAAYVHLVERRKRPLGRASEAIGAGLDLITLATSPLRLLSFNQSPYPLYDAYLHDASGRLLGWTREADRQFRFTDLDILLPDASRIAAVRHSEQERGRRDLTGVGVLAAAAMTTGNQSLWWGELPPQTQAHAWTTLEGDPVVRAYKSEQGYAIVEFPQESAHRPLAAAGALWWWATNTQEFGTNLLP